ncbi:DUF6716 putative glycosyltransferase [Microbacterium sp. CIAB417]|uniref:DUF6716 putative glycosyltransferase n=1 Tax=Microbacterium sp. CIAB417 TaxID=2860287 RepID=UPI001FABD21D|nr:DUF6716 putative glycosyltransferase [Microbacterium sp. CIAB417]
MSARLRVVAIADADSFVKWSASLLSGVDGIRRHLLLVTTPLTVSREQERTALAGTSFTDAEVTRLSFDEVRGWLAGHEPDAVVLAGRGPFVRLLGGVIDRLERRPVVIGGLPGMSIPAQCGALDYRRYCDLLVLHSHREKRAFAELGRRIGLDVPLALATLPYAVEPRRAGVPDEVLEHRAASRRSLAEHGAAAPHPLVERRAAAPRSLAEHRATAPRSLVERRAERGVETRPAPHADLAPAADTRHATGTATAVLTRPSATPSATPPATPPPTRHPQANDLVFAAQAMVPAQRHERAAIADILIRAAKADPRRRVVVKLRSRPGETETHLERDTYVDLLTNRPPNLVFSYQPMTVALERAQGLVTLSSTAAIEALALGVPVIALDTFGVHKSLLNTVFIGSGLLGGAEEVIRRRFRHPHPGWLWDNYFHPASESTWWEDVEDLIARRRAGELPARPVPAARGGRLHAAWHRKSVLGSADRSVAGAVALAVGTPLVRGILSRRRALADTWSETGTDYTLEPTPHVDPIRR